ncbi:MAG: SDR family NAD(P)-dependent oxidoreductase [Paracoccaceae bacterium]
MRAAELFSVDGKVAFVTGAAQGLGRAMARTLAINGARLALFDHDAAALNDTIAEIQAMGGEVMAATGDVTDAERVANAVDAALRHYGQLDICIANAAISDPDRDVLHRTRPENWARVVDVNLNGVFNTTRAALVPMVARGSGKIICVASMWGLAAPAALQPRPAYAATKGAVINLVRELALEYAAHGVQVNALCPGFFRTETRPRDATQEAAFCAFTPQRRIAEANEIGGTLLYLASGASDFMTGAALVIDGGVLAG